MKLVLIAVSCFILASASKTSTWHCETFETRNVLGKGGIVWWRGNCTGETPYGKVGPITINTLTADLKNPNVLVTTLHANSTGGVQPLPDMIKQDKRLVGGINGGYFFRTDVHHFFDDVCFGKTLVEAKKPASVASPNQGVGDNLNVKDGKLVSSNCNASYGNNRPTTLIINGTESHILVQHTAAEAPAGTKNAIGAGPNLVSAFDNGTTYVAIPKDDENVNILGHSANTAIGLRGARGDFSELLLVTFDGADSCHFDPTCGINAYPLASFMKDHMKATEAMNMDQGGSTTMVVAGEGHPTSHIVSCSSVPDCHGSGRELFNGLFVGFADMA